LPQPFDDAVRQARSLLVDCLIKHASDVAFTPGDWSSQELSLSDTLIPKYAGTEWTQRT
jgi:hypothetical protein